MRDHIVDGIVVEPARLAGAAAAVRQAGQPLAAAAVEVARSVDDAASAAAGSRTAAALAEFAAGAGLTLRSLALGVDSLAAALRAAAAHYVEVDHLIGGP
ncbi:MAG: hypothetical protein M3042_10785 [Actinomycetota bacterium]|nr:hypothetical protein [Actinomycetota bacterium]